MTTRSLRTRLTALAAAGLLCIGVSSAVTTSAAATAPVAALHLPAGFYDVKAGLDSMWAMGNDESTYSTLYRIDATTNEITEKIPLGFAGAFVAIGYGSVWVSDYYGNRLIRLDPEGRLLASIPVGLQPQFLLIAFGSVWTSNHHGHSLSRIDPNTNHVTATIQVGARTFRNGPQEMTSSNRYLYVESSNLTNLQRVDPLTNAVTNLADDGHVFGGDLIWRPGTDGGTLWNDSPHALDGYSITGVLRTHRSVGSGNVTTMVTLNDLLWIGVNPAGPGDGSLRGVSDRSGAPVENITLTAARAGTLAAGYGSVWNLNWDTGLLQRFNP